MPKSILPGFPVSLSDARTATAFLDDSTPVPASAQMLDGCAFTQGGVAYVCLYPAGGSANQTVRFLGGKAVRGDGAQIIKNAGTVAQYLRGIGYTALGELVVSTSTPICFPNGVGIDASGYATVSEIASGGGGTSGQPIGLLLILTKAS